MCVPGRPAEGVVTLTGVMELLPNEAPHAAAHVLHQEPWPLRGRHAHHAGEAHRAGMELLRLLHGAGKSFGIVVPWGGGICPKERQG